MLIFLTLLLAHLAGDFLLQRPAVVQGKRAGHWPAWAEHGAVHLGALILSWWLIQPEAASWSLLALGFALIVGSHLLIDWCKLRFGTGHELAAFLVDQLAHMIVLVVVTGLLLGSAGAFSSWFLHWHPLAPGFAALTAGYLAAVFGCGWLNRLLLKSMIPLPAEVGETPGGLADAGLRIGWLERFLMLSAFLVHAWAALGLVLAAKSVFRFEDLRKGRRHAEYFLIGTLLSVAEVVVIGTLLVVGLQVLEPSWSLTNWR